MWKHKLSNQLEAAAIQELDEFPNRISDALRYLREWLAKQPHIKAREDDQSLLNFLRNSKFSLERTKEKLDLFYTVRTIIPEFFTGRDPFLPEMQELLRQQIITIVTDSTNPVTPALLLCRWKTCIPETIVHSRMAKLMLMMMDVTMKEHESVVVEGMYVLNDFEGYSLSLAKTLTPTFLKNCVTAVQNAYPIKLNSANIINTPSYYITFCNVLKQFLKEKLRNRFNIYSDTAVDSLRRDIPLSILPEEYGGTAGPLDKIAVDWIEKLESYCDWFVQDMVYRTDESKRPMQQHSEGSFRKLEID